MSPANTPLGEAASPKRRASTWLKPVVGCILAAVLIYAGYQGRRRAEEQRRVAEITALRDQLQQCLDTAELSGSNTEVEVLIPTLEARLRNFVNDYKPAQLADSERLDLRTSQAALAIAQRQFTRALEDLSDSEEHGGKKGTSPGNDTAHRSMISGLRADALFGLGRWGEALQQYRQLLALRPDLLVPMLRAADCQFALGNTNEALTVYRELALAENRAGHAALERNKPEAAAGSYEKAIELLSRCGTRPGGNAMASELALASDFQGNAFLLQHKPDAAVACYQKAAEIQTRLVEQDGKRDLTDALASSLDNEGNAFLAQRKPGAAVVPYRKAIEIRSQAVKQNNRPELADELATTHCNAANALLALGKTEEALNEYQTAISLRAPLLQPGARSDLALDLAMSHNNRGVALRALQNLDGAMQDFDSAVELSKGAFEEPLGRGQAEHDAQPRGPDSPKVKLLVGLEFSERAIDLLTGTRLFQHRDQYEPFVDLALSLKNRGYANQARGNMGPALADFNEANGIYTRLVEQEGQRRFLPQFGRSLATLAWLYATCPDAKLRDSNKAEAFATKACEISEWKAFLSLEALAAAKAESGRFAEAVNWQEKALALAPAQRKAEVRSRLELYKSGRPYRAPTPKAE